MEATATLSKPINSMNGATTACGAKTRGGGRCKRIPRSNGKCRLHGGLSLKGAASGTFIDGKHSKYQYLPPVLTARIESINFDLIGNLEESIKIQQTRETLLHEKVNTGESPDAWKAILDILNDNDDDSDMATTPERQLMSIRLIAEGSLGETSLWREIQSFHDSQRKLSETVSKVRKEMQDTYTQEQWNVMMNILGNLLRKLFPDGTQLGQFYTELSALAKPEPKLISGTSR